MPKIVINTDYGGFVLSEEAKKDLGLTEYQKPSRTDPAFIALVEEKGSAYASGPYATLVVFDVPTDYYEIEEYGGKESIRVFEGPIPKSYYL